MYTLKVIALSASKKSVLASVIRKVGAFASEIAVGSIRLSEDVEVGSEHKLDGITSVTTRESIAEDGTVFNWLVLQ